VLSLGEASLSLGDELMEFDPARYADVASRVLRRGDWLHLVGRNGPFINEPPLMIWALAMAVLGPTSEAARLPSPMFAVLAVVGTFVLGRRLEAGRLGALVLAIAFSPRGSTWLVAGGLAVRRGGCAPVPSPRLRS
jgi:4-amino-4-deoxy-L-arabinose transferase-like glycosyltransferase